MFIGKYQSLKDKYSRMRNYVIGLFLLIILTPILFNSCRVEDSEILKEVQLVFAEDSLENMSITVANGTVILNGYTDSDAYKNHIESKIKRVKDVRAVKNNLLIISY